MTDIDAREVQAGPCTVHFLEAGAPGGQGVLLLHGMSFQAQTWQEIDTLTQLASAGHHAAALDLPGFGKSAPCTATPEEVLQEFIREVKLDRPVLVGPSMGGRVSLEFALAHPELVGGLVLVGAVGVQENRTRLGQIKVPCQIVWGGADSISPLENGRILESEIPDASLEVLDGAPHPCYLEQTDRWHQILLHFLKERFS